jgi:hypothetical protein
MIHKLIIAIIIWLVLTLGGLACAAPQWPAQPAAETVTSLTEQDKLKENERSRCN